MTYDRNDPLGFSTLLASTPQRQIGFGQNFAQSPDSIGLPQTSLEEFQRRNNTPSFLQQGSPKPQVNKGFDWSIFGDGKTWLGGEGSMGVAPLGLGIAQAGANWWMGNEQLKLGKDQLKTQQRQFSDQFNMQKALIEQDMYQQAQQRYWNSPALNPTPEKYMEDNPLPSR